MEELNKSLNLLVANGGLQGEVNQKETGFPQILTGQGCKDALRELMSSEWGTHIRSMNEIKRALEGNAMFFSKGILSGTLNAMIKSGELRRVKDEGRWKYVAK